MKWYPLSLARVVLLLVLVAITDAFTVVQHDFFPESVRPFTYLAFAFVLILIFFFFVRPEDPLQLSWTLCVILMVIVLFVILVQDVVLASNLSWRSIIVFLGAIIPPLAAGYVYRAVRKRRQG
jgi:membrane-associated HD superfamily phosphohydrolase